LRELVEHRCGWWQDIGIESLAAAIKEATALNDEARAEMGRQGRALILRKYSWERIGAEMRSVYEWLLGRSPKPECIVQL
jgi:glycosyltransferase involved in cell wall biosynthesis